MQKIVNSACGRTLLLDMSLLIGQKLMKYAKVRKLKYDNLSNFQTLCFCSDTQNGGRKCTIFLVLGPDSANAWCWALQKAVGSSNS